MEILWIHVVEGNVRDREGQKSNLAKKAKQGQKTLS